MKNSLIKIFRKRSGDEGKVFCPHPDYKKAYIVLPKEWTGDHIIRRNAILVQIVDQEVRQSEAINAAIAIVLVDDWGGIQGMESKDPGEWDLRKVPLPVLAWLSDVVLNDFLSSFSVPKNLSAPLLDGAETTK